MLYLLNSKCQICTGSFRAKEKKQKDWVKNSQKTFSKAVESGVNQNKKTWRMGRHTGFGAFLLATGFLKNQKIRFGETLFLTTVETFPKSLRNN